MDFPKVNEQQVNEQPMQDQIVSEVQASREALAAQRDGDVDPLQEEVERRGRASERERAAPSPKRLSAAASA